MKTHKKPADEASTTAKTASRSKNPKPPAKMRLKPGVPKPPRAKAAKRPDDVKPATVSGIPAPAVAPDTPAAELEMKKQELLARVVDRSEIKKKYAKPVVEAMIAVLGEALAEGRELNLPPLGKVKQNRTKETPTARIIIAKIRQKKPHVAGAFDVKESIADPAE
ncbi:HU family DNA-binding protein [Roseovarius sp. ZX-A-9]|uniref:HU family DNA-binding protein n=1 Tax=Roseovarius sp. ZX-A-9 TaxID=3014783 RepID=UPI00232E3673|nr:HU family DNA-binding protein [Roseovarius sp. ZX-A-9]